MAEHLSIATKFLVISDTHNFQFGDTAGSQHLQLPTPKVDVLLYCGDLTEVGGVSSFNEALKMLGGIDAELELVIPGNHDMELDKSYWEAQRDYDGAPEDPEDHDLAFQAMTGPLAKQSVITFLGGGTLVHPEDRGETHDLYFPLHTGLLQLGFRI